MDNVLTQKCIMVCDFEYFPILFQLKAKYPQAEWKILKKDDLLDRVCFSFVKDPIPHLLKKGIDYASAKKYLRLLRVANIEANPSLQSLYDELNGMGFIGHDDLGALELSRGKVVLLEMKEDAELHELLKRKSIPFADMTLEELGAVKALPEGKKPLLLSFPNKFAQYFYIYAQIRKEILLDESAKKRITILINDESDLYYVKTVSSLFKIPSFAVFLRPFLSNPAVKRKVTQIYAAKSFVFTEEEKADSDLAELLRIVDYYGLSTLPFDFAYASLLEIANTLGIKENIDDKGITIENRFTIDPSARVFVTNFQYGVFYKVFDDKNVLTDQELTEISANPSYVLTRIDRTKKLNYLRYNGIALLSRVRQHLTDKIYDSQFLEELGWDPKSDVIKAGMNPDGVYTTAAGRLYLADQLDKQFYPYSYGQYRGYDHSFKGLDREMFVPTRNWSITDLERYILCPFQYYLDKLIPEEADDKHAMWLGILIHKVMERVLANDFDFDAEFAAGIEDYKKAMVKVHQTFGPKEEVWLEAVRYWLQVIVASIRQSKQVLHLAGEKAEQTVTFSLEGSNGTKYQFANAKIDKIILTEAEGQRFYTIIDYKSGKENFNAKHVFLGPSCQLPLYYYAIGQSPDKDMLTGKGTFGGFGIIHSYASSPRDITVDGDAVSADNVRTFVRMGGLTRNSTSYWTSLDATGFTKDGKVKARGGDYFAAGVLFDVEDGQTSIIPKAKTNPPYNFNRFIEEAKTAMVDTIERILCNEFPIHPTSYDLEPKEFTRLVCANCPYGDVCYKHAAQDAVSYRKTINDHFNPEIIPEIDNEMEDVDHE